jgi:hypothetical protein
LEHSLHYTPDYVEEFVRWKRDPQSGASECPNLYVKIQRFMSQLPRKDAFPVMVKTMDGTLIPLDYSPTLDRTQLSWQLTAINSLIYPMNHTAVFRLTEDETIPVEKDEIFGCMVLPIQFVTFHSAKEYVFPEEPGIMYLFTIRPDGFIPFQTGGIVSKPSYPIHLHIIHLFEKNKFYSQQQHYMVRNIPVEYNTVEELLKKLNCYYYNGAHAQNRITLKSETIEEILSVFQIVRRI